MDNDSNLKKTLVKVYKNIRFKLDYSGMELMQEEDGNLYIASLLKADKSFMVGRFGAVEMRCVSRWMARMNYTVQELSQAKDAAGIFPNTPDIINQFCEVYTESMKDCDVLGVWEVVGEKKAISKYCKNVVLIPSRSIEPYYFEEPWSRYLSEKKVLIVHPFADTIKSQILQRNLIWPHKDILPEFRNVSFVKSVQSNAGADSGFDNWFNALDYMKSEIAKKDFDVAIVGAGAYGFPLCSFIKSIGKQAIQMSGATQILFGIKGKRWDSHPVISEFYNDAWVRPSKNETPPEITKVEGGSYW